MNLPKIPPVTRGPGACPSSSLVLTGVLQPQSLTSNGSERNPRGAELKLQDNLDTLWSSKIAPIQYHAAALILDQMITETQKSSGISARVEQRTSEHFAKLVLKAIADSVTRTQ